MQAKKGLPAALEYPITSSRGDGNFQVSAFTNVDWAVVAGYLLLTTWVGHLLRGKQASMKDFFLGGRSLPWPAVSGSIIATEISGVTFIGVPGMVYAAQGDFTYLQWGLGSIIARVIVGFFFVRAFYEREIYSPYDYMGYRLGEGVKRLATIVFQIGGILGQSVRVLVAALALKVVTPLEFEYCILIIGAFAICWTLMGGMRTVIWTDVMQFFLFVGAGLLSLFWMLAGIEGGWAGMVEVSGAAEKFTLLNLSRDPAAGFTLWVAIIAVPFQNVSMFGVDQLNAQRMFCCRSESDARKAILTSSAGLLITVLMLLVGAALYAFYHQAILPDSFAQFSSKIAELQPKERKDAYYPVWIVSELPEGLRGLILAGIFAAAISSLDSILAALSQTTLSLFRKTGETPTEATGQRDLYLSRLLVIGWGLALSAFAIALDSMRGEVNVVVLAFGMTSYTVGPMLGFFLAAFFTPRASLRGLALGFALSFALVVCLRTDAWTILANLGVLTDSQIAQLPTMEVVKGAPKAIISSVWAWPVTVFITWGCGLLVPRRDEPGEK
jgi:SSS family transporter